VLSQGVLARIVSRSLPLAAAAIARLVARDASENAFDSDVELTTVRVVGRDHEMRAGSERFARKFMVLFQSTQYLPHTSTFMPDHVCRVRAQLVFGCTGSGGCFGAVGQKSRRTGIHRRLTALRQL